MEQMNVPEEMKIEYDFDNENATEAVRTLQPLIYRDGPDYHCVIGPDLKNGIVGVGSTVNEALLEWESKVRKRIIYHTENDELAAFIIDKLNASPKNVG
jgi:hypothetical protein